MQTRIAQRLATLTRSLGGVLISAVVHTEECYNFTLPAEQMRPCKCETQRPVAFNACYADLCDIDTSACLQACGKMIIAAFPYHQSCGNHWGGYHQHASHYGATDVFWRNSVRKHNAHSYLISRRLLGMPVCAQILLHEYGAMFFTLEFGGNDNVLLDVLDLTAHNPAMLGMRAPTIRFMTSTTGTIVSIENRSHNVETVQRKRCYALLPEQIS